MSARFSVLQARAVSDPRISNAQFRTLAALGMYGDKNGWCFPKLQTLGKMLGKTKQAVSKDLQALAELGYVQIKKQFRDDGSQQNNLYRLLFDADTRQPDVDPGKQDDNPPSTSEVDPPSTSEVDALTPHINDPKEVEEEPPSTFQPPLTSADVPVIVSEATGMPAIPSTQLKYIDQILTLACAYGREVTVEAMRQAFIDWTSRSRKDGSGRYRATNFGWVDWAQEILLGNNLPSGTSTTVIYNADGSLNV